MGACPWDDACEAVRSTWAPVTPRFAELRQQKSGLDLASRPLVANEAGLFLLLALGVRLRRLLVRRLGLLGGLSRLLLRTRLIVAAVLLGRRPMSFRSLLVMFGSLLVHVLRHSVSLLFGGAQTNVSRSRLFRRAAKSGGMGAEKFRISERERIQDRHNPRPAS